MGNKEIGEPDNKVVKFGNFEFLLLFGMAAMALFLWWFTGIKEKEKADYKLHNFGKSVWGKVGELGVDYGD